MSVKRQTINLTLTGNTLTPVDAATQQPVTSVGVQGEDGAVWLHCDIPTDWQELSCRLCVIALDGSYDESGLPVSNAIDMPLRQGVLVPGRLVVSLKGSDGTGVRKTADCASLYVEPSDTGTNQISDYYPQEFEELREDVTSLAQSAVDSVSGAVSTHNTAADAHTALFGAKLNAVPATVPAGVDWNTLQTSGTYLVPANNANSPTTVFPAEGYGISMFLLSVTASSSAYVTQTAYTAAYANASPDKDRHRVFTRRWFATSGWSAWREVMTNDTAYRKAEVDTALSTHNTDAAAHDLRFSQKLDNHPTALYGDTDFDSLTSSGIFVVSSSAANSPAVASGNYLVYVVVDGLYEHLLQIAYTYSSSTNEMNEQRMFVRRYYLMSGWSVWNEVMTNDTAYRKAEVDTAVSQAEDSMYSQAQSLVGTHNTVGNAHSALFAAKINKTITSLPDGSDLNNVSDLGYYKISASNSFHVPLIGYTPCTFWFVEVLNLETTCILQKSYPVGYKPGFDDTDKPGGFIRRFDTLTGVWTPWKKMLTEDDAYLKNQIDTLLNEKMDSAAAYSKIEIDQFLFGKQDVVTGKGLSTNDYSTAEKTKLAGIAIGAQVNPTSTDGLAEGTTNKYYTDDRADARITAQKGYASGLAGLDASGSVPASELANLLTPPLTNQSSVWQTGQGANGVAAVKNGSPVNVSSLKGQTTGGNSVTNLVLTATGKNLLHDATFTAAAGHAGCCNAKGMLLPNTTYTLSVVLPVGEQFYANEQLFTGSPFTAVGDGVTRQYVVVTTQSSISTSNSSQYNATYGWGLFKNASASVPVSGNASALQVEYGRNSTAYEPYKTTQLTIPGTYRSNGTASDEVNLVGTRWMFTQRIGTDGSALATPATTDITAQVTGGLTAYSGGHILVSTDTGIYPSVDMQYVADAAQFAGTWVPTLTWTTGTPTITQSTFSYVLRGKMCRICAYMGMSNGAGATNLTMTLPLPAKSFGGIKPTPLATQIAVSSAWSNGMSYVDDANNLIKFRAAVTLTNGSPAVVSICGEYEVA